MAADFPDNPSVNDTFTVSDRTWIWNGTTWDALTEEVLSADAPITFDSSARTVGIDEASIAIDQDQVTGLADGTSGYSAVSDGASLTYQPISHNYVINGAFDIWQRGDGPFETQSQRSYTTDRWTIGRNTGAGNASVRKSSEVPNGFINSAKIQRTAGDTNDAPFYFTQNLETWTQEAEGQDFIISFWFKAGADFNPDSTKFELMFTEEDYSSVSYFLNGTFRSDNTGYQAINTLSSELLNASTSWTRYSTSFTVPSGKKTGQIAFEYFPQGTAGADESFYITGVQLEAGSIATPFKRNANSIQGELAACQRYYFRTVTGSPYQVYTQGNYHTSTNVRAPMFLPHTMRTTPSFNAVGNFQTQNNVPLPTTDWFFVRSSSTSGELDIDMASTSATGAATIRNANDSSAYLEWDAEL